jgi:hypothetical protein
VQLLGELPLAGFPSVRHLGNFKLSNGSYDGPLYEVRGQAFRRLDRDFPDVRDAERVAPESALAAPLPASFCTQLLPAAERIGSDAFRSSHEEVAAKEGSPTLVCCCMHLQFAAPREGDNVRCCS